MTKVVFPSFSGKDFKPFEMRQLVSALELRFQALESNSQSIFDTDVPTEGEFAPIDHTHVEADITDLQPYLLDITGQSIFNLSDVAGTPGAGYTLIWDGVQFVAAPSGVGSLQLSDLIDVDSTLAPNNDDVLQYDAVAGEWVAGTIASSASLAGLTDTDLTGQQQYDMLYNVNGSEWRNTAGLLQWNPFGQYLQLANQHSINWEDAGMVSVEMLNMQGVAGQPVNFVTNESNIDTLAPTTAWVDAQLDQAQSAFGNGDEILVVAHALLYNESNSAANDNGFRIIADGVALTGSTQQAEGLGASVPRDAANPYGYMGWFTCNTAGTNIKTQVALGSGGTNYVCTAENTLLLNLTKDVPNHVKATSTVLESIQSTLPTWVTLDTNITIGAGDWLVIASMKTIGGRSGSTREGLALRIGGTYPPTGNTDDEINIAGRVIEDSAQDELCYAGALYLEGYAGGTITMLGTTGGGLTANTDYKSIIAIPMSDFANHWGVQLNDTERNLALQSTDETINTINVASIPTTANYLCLAWGAFEWVGTSETTGHEIQENVNAAGATLVGWNNEWRMRKTTNTDTWENQIIFTNPRSYSAGDQVTLTQVAININASFATHGHRSEGMLLLEMNGLSSEEFVVGDPGYPTRIDGTQIDAHANLRIYDATEADYIDIAHDGTDVNFTTENTDYTNFLNTKLYVKGDAGGGYSGIELQTDATNDAGAIATYNIQSSQYLEIATYGATYTTAEYPSGGVPHQLFFSSAQDPFAIAGDLGEYARYQDITATKYYDLTGGTHFRIFDSTDADSVDMSHDGTDFDTVFTQTGVWDISGLTTSVRLVGDIDFDIRDGAAQFWRSGDNVAYARMAVAGTSPYSAQLSGSTLSSFEFVNITDRVWVRDGTTLRVGDAGDTDWGEFSHDGTNFLTDFTQTAYWLVTGATQEYRFDRDINIRDADGNKSRVLLGNPVAQANNANDGEIILYGENNSSVFGAYINNPSTYLQVGGTTEGGVSAVTTLRSQLNIDIYGGGSHLRLWDAAIDSSALFQHGGTDFATTFTGTVDWDITGLTGEMFVDADLRTSGNLTVGGTTTTINSNVVSIADNIILLNSDAVDPPTENAGLEIYRGGVQASTFFLWDETTDAWTFYGNDGTTELGRFTNLSGDVQLILPQLNDQGDPALAFGDGDTGIFELSDDFMAFSIAATYRWAMSADNFQAANASGPMLRNLDSATNAVILPNRGDANTGISSGGADQLDFRTGNNIRLHLEEDGNHYWSSILDAATGDEIAFDLNYTVNKLTSGNDTGVRIRGVDTASPGTSKLLSLWGGAAPVERVSWGPAGDMDIIGDRYIQWNTGANTANFNFNGSDWVATMAGTGLNAFVFNLAGAAVSIRQGSDLDIRDGGSLIIRDGGDTDDATFSHDGTDFNTVFTQTTDWNIDGLTGGAWMAGGSFNLRSTVAVSSPPVDTDSPNVRYRWVDLTGTGTGEYLAEVGFAGNADFQIQNRVHGGRINIQQENSAGTLLNLFILDPDASILGYHQGDPFFSSNAAGVVTRDTVLSNNPAVADAVQGTQLRYQNAAGSQNAMVGFDGSSQFEIENFTWGGAIYAHSRNATGSDTGLWIADPDGNMILYNAGAQVARTAAAASGGFEANNTLTGAGFERVLTVSDIGGGGIPSGTATDSTLRWSGSAWVEDTTHTADGAGAVSIIRGTNANSSLTVGEETTLYGDGANAELRLWGEQGGVIYGGQIIQPGAQLQINGIGANPATGILTGLQLQVAGSTVDLQQGTILRIRESGNTDYSVIDNTLTALRFRATNTADIEFQDYTGNFWLRDGLTLRISDAGDTDWAEMSHDGTDFNTTFTQTGDWVISGHTGDVEVQSNIHLIADGSKYGFVTGGGAARAAMESNATHDLIFRTSTAVETMRLNADGINSLFSNSTEVHRTLQRGDEIASVFAPSTQEDITDASTTISTSTLTKAGENFLSTVAVGDLVEVYGGTTTADYGIYPVTAVGSNTEITVQYTFTATNTDVDFRVIRGVQFRHSSATNAVYKINFPSGGDPSHPKISFGDGDTGFWEVTDDALGVSFQGVKRWDWEGTYFASAVSGGAYLKRSAGALGTPTFSFVDDLNTGLTSLTADQVSIVGGGVELGLFTNTATTLRNYVFNVDQTVSATEDGYALIYNDGTGEIQLTDIGTVSGGVADGTSTNNTLRWSGTAWVENSGVTADASNNLTVTGTVTAASGRGTFDFSGPQLQIIGNSERIGLLTPNLADADTLRMQFGGGQDTSHVTVYDADFRMGGDSIMMYTNNLISVQTGEWDAATGALTIYDTTGTDSAVFSHDGTDFNTAFTTTTDWNITGANLVVGGDLTVNGTTTTINSNTVAIADNIIVLNSDEAGVPSQNAGLEVERGTSANVFFQWNETNDSWEFVNESAETIGDFRGTGTSRQLLLPQINNQATPTLAFGDGNTGFYEQSDNVLAIGVAGGLKYNIDSASIRTDRTNSAEIRWVAPTATVPGFTFAGDSNTGIGYAGADQLSLIAGGVEQARLQVSGNHVINSLLDEATGDEIALSLDYTVNKATSGADTGLRLNVTETASPGTSLFAEYVAGGVTKFSWSTNPTFTMYDDTGADSAAFNHDGTDFNTTFTGTTDWNISGSSNIFITTGTTALLTGGTLQFNDSTNADSSTVKQFIDRLQFTIEPGDRLAINTDVGTQLSGGGYLELRDGGTFTIYDTGDTDSAAFSHDGVDFDTVFTQTADWDITGLTGSTNFGDATNPGSISIHEGGGSPTNVAGKHFLFTRNDAPTTLMEEDDAGNIRPLTNIQKLDYEYSSTVTAADPGQGVIRFDSVTIGSIANAYIDDLERGGHDAGWLLSNLADGDILTFRTPGDPADYIIASVNGTPTDNTGWWTVPLTLIHTGTIFTDTDQLQVTVEWASQAGGGIADGTQTDAMLRWSGSAWVENTTARLESGNAEMWLNNVADIITGFNDTSVPFAIGNKTSGGTFFSFDAYGRMQAQAASAAAAISINTDGGSVSIGDSSSPAAAHIINLNNYLVRVTNGTMEIASAADDKNVTTGYGQLWVKNDTPERMFYSDGNDTKWPLQSVHEAEYAYSSTVTAADPGTATLRFDSVTIGSIANLYIDDLALSEDWGWILSNLADGDVLSIKSAIDAADYIIASVNGTPTDNTGWWTVPLTLIHTGTIFTDGDPLRIEVEWLSQVPPGVADGTTTDSTLRWSGSAWVETADVRSSSTGQFSIWNGADNVEFNHDGNDLLVTGTQTATMEFVNLPVQLDDAVALQFGTGNDIQMSWDAVDIEITSALANPTWNFRDGHHLRLWDSTDTDYVDFHHDGTDFNIAAGTTTDINFTGLTAINTNADVAIGNNTFSLTDGTDSFTFSATAGVLDLTTTGGATTFDVGLNVFASTLRLNQRSAAPTNTAATGYFWVRDDDPTTPWFTDDATGDLPLGINGMPPVAISASQNMLLSQVGKMLHKNAGVAITLTCAQDADTWDGASWGVHNDDTEDLTIAAGAGVTVYWIEGGAAPVAGSVTVTQGGIVTVYKYSNTEFWVWGAKDTVSAGAIALDDLSNVVITSPLNPSYLRYNGTNWIDASLAIVDDPSPQLGSDLQSNTFDIDMADNDFVTFGTGRDVAIGWDGVDLEVTGLTNNQTINFRDGQHIRLWDSTDTDWLDIHNDGANIVLTESGVGNLVFPSTPLTFGIDMNDNQIDQARLKDYSIESEAYTPTGTTQTLTYSTGPAFEVDLESVTGNITITLSGGPPSGTYGNIIVKVTQDSATARTITWAGGTFEWAGGTAHVMNSTLNGYSIYTFETWDGGTTWFGAGEDYS